MKKLLYGTTALVAAGLLSGAAVAQEEGITGSLSGWWVGQFASISQDDGVGEAAANRRDHEFQRFGTITLSGNTELDNGLQVGVSFDWNTETVGAEVGRDGFVFMEFGGFRLELGSRQGAPNIMGYAAPTPSMFAWGFNSPVFTNATAGNNTAAGPAERITVSGTNEKLNLFTPRFGGFQLGGSYTPDATKDPDGFGVFGGPPTDNDAGQQSEVVEIGANFVQSFDELDLSVSAGWAEGDLELAAAGAEDRSDWTVGTSISYMSWTFGAGYKDSNQGTSAANTDRTDWNAGIRYVTGPWGVGIQYQETETELGTGAGEDEAERFELGASYDVGPGIAFHLGIQFVEYSAVRAATAAVAAVNPVGATPGTDAIAISSAAANTLANENDSVAIYIGTSIFF